MEEQDGHETVPLVRTRGLKTLALDRVVIGCNGGGEGGTGEESD